MIDRVREQDRVERVIAHVPARLDLLGVDSLEGLRPLLRAAEHDRVGQVLGEDVVLLGELLHRREEGMILRRVDVRHARLFATGARLIHGRGHPG